MTFTKDLIILRKAGGGIKQDLRLPTFSQFCTRPDSNDLIILRKERPRHKGIGPVVVMNKQDLRLPTSSQFCARVDNDLIIL